MTRRATMSLGLALAIAAAALLALPLLMLIVSTGSMSDRSETCGPAGGADLDVSPVSAGAGGLGPEQRANAATVVAVGHRLGVPRRGLVVALAVAHQESRFLNYANDGRGDDLTFFQRGIERSLALPYEAVGSDHGSLGVFQQQWPWWGSMEELMDPATAAEKFYRGLLAVPGWQQLSITQAGQAVQRSAYPDAYADDVPLALALLDDPTTSVSAAIASGLDGDCLLLSGPPGTVVHPMPPGFWHRDAGNWGATGGRWSRGHTGTDFSAPCGTPVLAATAGTVIVRTDQPWSGPWLVQVSTGVGRLTTWYAHLQAVHVTDGQQVEAGQQLGQVGDLGNSTGCHLHFEVHPRGGSIYQDGVDPTLWLRHNLGRELDVPAAPTAPAAGSSRDGFVVATLNVLGHSHTAPGGRKESWDASDVRMRRAVSLLDRHAIDVVGLQEVQGVQARAFRRLAGSTYQLHSPPGDTENSIAYRRSRWQHVDADTVAIPYFNGRIRHMPVLRLRDRTTNQDAMFVNVHNPADTGRFPRQERHRTEAVRRQVALVRELHQRHELPVFLVGDLNDRRDAFCRLTSGSLMVASAGGSNRGACSPPPGAGIDWIFATPDVTLVDHRRVRDPLVGRTTDHPLVLSRAVVAR